MTIKRNTKQRKKDSINQEKKIPLLLDGVNLSVLLQAPPLAKESEEGVPTNKA
jgi:hypothetical protein